jgi:PAS domain S-box-containing protein
MEEGMEFNVIRPAAYGVDFYGDTLFTSREMAVKHPDRVAAFKRATLEGWEYAMANKGEIIDLILDKYNSKKAKAHLEYEAATMEKLILPNLIAIGHINPGRWDHIAKVFVQHGAIEETYSLDGFIFNPDPPKDYFWMWVTIGSLAGVAILFSIVSIMLLIFNNRLNREVTEKEKSKTALARNQVKLKHLDTINRIIINTRDTDKMLQSLLDAMLDMFDCDRVWLMYPCDPLAEKFSILVEKTRPAYPGFGESGVQRPMEREIASSMKRSLETDGPVVDDGKTVSGIPGWITEKYHIKSAIRMALYPKIDDAWMLGMHKCRDEAAPWTDEDKLLFNTIGRRISDGLNAILLIRELKQANKTLLESEDRFEKIFDASPVGILIVTLDELKILNMNKSLEAVTGFSREEFIGKTLLADDCFIAPDSIVFLENLKREPFFNYVDIQFHNRENQVRDGRFSSQQVDINGKHCIIITIEDVTEYKQVETEKHMALQHAAEQEKYALIGQVAGKIAHDFNNILGAIMGNAELSLLDCRDKAAVKTFELILDQTKKGRNLTKNLVVFAKDQEPRQDYFNINEKINLVLDLLRKDLQGISITTFLTEPLPELLADPGMIENALVNLIHNAIHAVSKNKSPVLTLRTHSDDENIFIGIEDNGCGIPKEHQNSIWAPAFTLKSDKDILSAYDKTIKGTGYGLFNVKKIIEKHRGRIWFDTEVDRGTRFSIRLPVIKKNLTEKEKAEVEKTLLHRGRKILIVEDERSIADVQYAMLTGAPFSHTVDLALDFLERNDYDLISLDYRLPGGLNGMEIYTLIRKKNTRVPIVFISGNIEFLESIAALTQKDSRLDHLSKPCRNKEYVACISRLFDRCGGQDPS